MSSDTRATATAAPQRRGTHRLPLLSNLLIVLGAILLVPAALFPWAEATFFDASGFADASSEAVENDAVQDRVAAGLTDRVVESNPDLEPARPLIKGAAGAVIDSPQFEAILRSAVERLHERVFDEDKNELVLDLTAALRRIVALIEIAAPQLAERIPPNLESGLITISESDFRTQLIRLSDRVSFLAFVFPVLSLASFAGGVYLSRSRREALFRVGMALAIVAAIVLLVLLIGSRLVTESVRNAENASAADGIWWAFVDSLRASMRVFGVAGIALAAGTWWVSSHGWPWRKDASDSATTPES